MAASNDKVFFPMIDLGLGWLQSREDMFDLDFLPYLFLLISVITCWTSSARASLFLLCGAGLIALWLERIEPLGVGWLLISGLTLGTITRLPLRKGLKELGTAVFLLLAVALSNHFLPGFNNLLIFNRVQFSPDSRPFSMYLNFDKTAIGILIFLFCLKAENKKILEPGNRTSAFKTLIALFAITLPLALTMNYVKFDPKLPTMTGLWILNNLFFVAFAEEALFRGFIQGGLAKVIPHSSKWAWIPLIAGSLAFGLDHFRGGLSYILWSSFAGLFYGYAYQQTKSLEASILVHFGFNLTHFTLFSYPSLQT